MRALLLIMIALLMVACGKSVTGSNAELDVVHTGGPDCTQSGCHSDFGAGGTVFANLSSSTAVSGMTVKVTNIANLQSTTIGTTDILGTFYYEGSLSGSFQMTVGSRQSGTYVHLFPNDKGCNVCHKWPTPSGGAAGRLY